MPHISIKAEKIWEIFGFPITNSLLLSYLFLTVFFILALVFSSLSQKKTRLVFFVYFLLSAIYSFFSSITKERVKDFFPLLASFFLFILFSNWLGLIPGVGSLLFKHNHHATPLFRGATADINMTFALAIVSVASTQIYGIKYLGSDYIKKFINLINPLNFFVGILEIFSEISKLISFSFRLFGNIFAGEVLLVVVAMLIPILASFPFLLLELFVGLIQALVFSMLTAVFLSSATVKDGH